MLVIARPLPLALYANVQRLRRDKIENVIVIPPGSPLLAGARYDRFCFE